jgi:altronate dehydratase small subunit
MRGGRVVSSGHRPGSRGASAPSLLVLADGDDVLIAAGDLQPGAHRSSSGEEVVVIDPVQLGHKVAARAIAAGERVVRCGVPIGSATTDIEPGAWVHTHNLESGYLATFAHRGGEH